MAAACGAALALTAASPASAHAGVVGTDPEDGANLDVAPESISVTFSERLDGPSTEIAVTGPEGEEVELEAAAFDGDTFTQPMRYTVAGQYTVAFRVISEDGHRVDDSFTFTVGEIPVGLFADGAGETEPEDDDPQPDPPAEADGETPVAIDAEEPAEGASESDTGTVLATVLLVALVVALGAVLLVKLLGRRRTKDS